MKVKLIEHLEGWDMTFGKIYDVIKDNGVHDTYTVINDIGTETAWFKHRCLS